MSVKLSRIIFKRIRGKIIPIRKGIQRATKSQNKLADQLNKFKNASKEFREAKRMSPKRTFFDLSKKKIINQRPILKGDFKKIGSGVDFDVFGRKSSKDFVIKMEKIRGGRATKGTGNKAFTRRWPELSDKVAVHKALGDNLPDFGFSTIPSEIIRLRKGRRGILQDHLNPKRFKGASFRFVDEGKRFERNSGVNLDIHSGNVVDNWTLSDTGGALSKSRVTDLDDIGKEVLGIGNNFGTNIKDVYKKADILSDTALIQGQSPKTLRKINALMKKGYGFRRVGKNEFKLSPKKIKLKAGSKLHKKITAKGGK